MKKTIIITLAMLIIFGGAIIFGADRVSDQWQTPQKDDNISISIESPIENMESEIKKYPYKSNDEAELEKGAVSYQEAVYAAGTVLEQIYKDINLQNQTAEIYQPNMRTRIAPGHYEACYSSPKLNEFTNEIEDFVYLVFWFDPVDGKVSYIRRIDDKFVTLTEVTDVETEIDDSVLLDKSLEFAEIMGFGECEEYAISSETLSVATDTNNYYSVVLRTKDNELIEFTYYNNPLYDYPLNIFSNYTSTAVEEILGTVPNMKPIP